MELCDVWLLEIKLFCLLLHFPTIWKNLLMTITNYSDRHRAKSAQGPGPAAGPRSVSQGHFHGL